MCFVWISEQTATFVLNNINRLILYNRGGVFTTRYALNPYIKQTESIFKGLIVFVCSPCCNSHRVVSPLGTLPPAAEWGSTLPLDCFVSRGSISHSSLFQDYLLYEKNNLLAATGSLLKSVIWEFQTLICCFNSMNICTCFFRAFLCQKAKVTFARERSTLLNRQVARRNSLVPLRSGLSLVPNTQQMPS
jgi:hypothetical protein